jgi:hypothetical protein
MYPPSQSLGLALYTLCVCVTRQLTCVCFTSDLGGGCEFRSFTGQSSPGGMLSRAKVSIHVGFGFGALVATLVYATRYRRHGGRLVRIQLWLGALLRPVMSTAHRSTPATQAPYNLLLTLTGAGDGLRGGVPAEAMSISCGLAHDRKVHMTDSRIEDCWNTKMATGSKLFDQSKFRLRRISWAGAGASVTIELGLTSYKEYIGTHRLPPDELAVLEGDGTVLGDLRCATQSPSAPV